MQREANRPCPNCKGPLGPTQKRIWVIEFSPSGSVREPTAHNVYRCATCKEEAIYLRK